MSTNGSPTGPRPIALPAGVDVASHRIIWVEGDDAVSFLDGQLSQDVAAMGPGTVARSFLLGPRGKLRALLWLLRGDNRVGIVADASGAEEVVADLDRYLFRVSAEVALDDVAIDSYWGAWEARDAGWEFRGDTLVAVTGDVPAAFASTGTLDAARLEVGEVDAHRARAGEPRFGVDVDERTIPQETGLVESAVSFTKGCYLGQELVARIDSRGHVNRMLRRVDVAGAPRRGAEVFLGSDSIGTLTTAAPVGGGSVALGLLRREASVGDEVEVRWDKKAARGRIVEPERLTSASHTSNIDSR